MGHIVRVTSDELLFCLVKVLPESNAVQSFPSHSSIMNDLCENLFDKNKYFEKNKYHVRRMFASYRVK